MFVEIQKENIMRSGGPAWKELIESARWETVQRLGKKEFRSSGDRRQETGDTTVIPVKTGIQLRIQRGTTKSGRGNSKFKSGNAKSGRGNPAATV
jgi:hypothetical protein